MEHSQDVRYNPSVWWLKDDIYSMSKKRQYECLGLLQTAYQFLDPAKDMEWSVFVKDRMDSIIFINSGMPKKKRKRLKAMQLFDPTDDRKRMEGWDK
jgi:hypothetical protein